MLKNKKVLITGATGFIGSNIVHGFLSKGAEIYACYPDGDDEWRIADILKDISNCKVDLLNKQVLKEKVLQIRPQIIIHTAVYGGHIWQKDTERIIKTNLIGTMNLLESCRNIDFEIFINTGSSSEYGIKSQAMKESDSLEPLTVYGVSKAAATLYCQEVARRQKRPITTLRLFSPYGYYDDAGRLVSSAVISCLEGNNPQVSNPNCVRDFIFIEDIIEAYIKTIATGDKVKGEIFNIGSGRQYTIGQTVEEIIKLAKNTVCVKVKRKSNSRIEPKVWKSDISKAKKILKWQPKYNLRKGLKQTIGWFRENYSLYEKM